MIRGRKFIIYAIALVLLFSISLFGGCTGCQKKAETEEPMATQEMTPEETPVQEYTPPPAEETPMAPAEEAKPMVPMFDISDIVDVFYAFDKSELSSDSRDTLAADAKLLKAAGDAKIVIEGHCDERGTNEYNLGLGERRANAAKDYLVSLGISASRIKTISYGEEKPFASGHSEGSWKQNRRAHFGLQ